MPVGHRHLSPLYCYPGIASLAASVCCYREGEVILISSEWLVKSMFSRWLGLSGGHFTVLQSAHVIVLPTCFVSCFFSCIFLLACLFDSCSLWLAVYSKTIHCSTSISSGEEITISSPAYILDYHLCTNPSVQCTESRSTVMVVVVFGSSICKLISWNSKMV